MPLVLTRNPLCVAIYNAATDTNGDGLRDVGFAAAFADSATAARRGPRRLPRRRRRQRRHHGGAALTRRTSTPANPQVASARAVR
ncbi:hypothetical protein AB5I41_24540 [Sphingomonas sp. MMS24-JH45]